MPASDHIWSFERDDFHGTPIAFLKLGFKRYVTDASGMRITIWSIEEGLAMIEDLATAGDNQEGLFLESEKERLIEELNNLGLPQKRGQSVSGDWSFEIIKEQGLVVAMIKRGETYVMPPDRDTPIMMPSVEMALKVLEALVQKGAMSQEDKKRLMLKVRDLGLLETDEEALAILKSGDDSEEE